MEKMKMSVGKMAALVLVVTAVSGLVMSFGMVYAGGPSEVKIEFELKLKEKNGSVEVEVKAKGLAPDEDFAMRGYSSTDCGSGPILKVGPVDSDSNGDLKIEGTFAKNIGDVNSVSIRDDEGTTKGDIVQCFLNTTP